MSRKQSSRLDGEVVCLEPIGVGDVSDEYVGWLNDPAVNRYLEVRHTKQTVESTAAYIRSFYEGVEKYMWAVRAGDNGKMIGTATLQSFDQHNRSAGIGMLIGDRDYWGTGAARETLDLVLHYAFVTCHLHRILCHNMSTNIQSNFMLQRAGFTREGIARKAFHIGNDEYVDGFDFSLLVEEWQHSTSKSLSE